MVKREKTKKALFICLFVIGYLMFFIMYNDVNKNTEYKPPHKIEYNGKLYVIFTYPFLIFLCCMYIK